MAEKTSSIVESASPSSIFKKNFVKFKNLLARDPNFCDFTDIFFSKDLITKHELDAINSQPNLSTRQKSSKVTHSLYERIKNSDDPKKCVLAICEALEDDNIDDNQAKKIATAIRTDIEPPLQVHVLVHDPELPLVSAPIDQDNTKSTLEMCLEKRIWTRGEDGEDVIELCIEKLKESRIFPDDNKLMHRIARVMSRNSDKFCNDGGIWQVSAFAFDDTHDTRSHIRLGRKYERIMQHFGINWRKVERSYLTIPIYSAIAARLYLSNFPKFIPPEYNVREQADYWWEIYMEKHESRDFIKCQTFIDTVTVLEGDSDTAVPCIEKRILIRGESGEDVVNLCIEKVHASGIASIDGVFLRRVAFVMSRDGKPPFPLYTDGGIWQVSLFAFRETQNVKVHAHLKEKFEKIFEKFGIDWSKAERKDLAIPMYSSIAASLYMSNFKECIPPACSVEEQADYWWNIYMKDHESKRFMERSHFIYTVTALECNIRQKAVDALASLSGKLSIAITPCLGSVVNELYAERLIVFELKDELINGEGTNAKKANKLVTELERSLKVEDEPEQVLQKLCSVLMRHNEPQLTQIAKRLLLITEIVDVDLKTQNDRNEKTSKVKRTCSSRMMCFTVVLTFLVAVGSIVLHHTFSPTNETQLNCTKKDEFHQEPSLEQRIWMSGETGKDVVNLCIQNLYKSGIFPDDHGLMRRIAHVMSNDGNPPFPLHTDGGIWQVSLFAFSDTHDTRAHIRLGRKYGAIMKHFDIDWRKVERIDLAIPMYSAIAARLYLSNFAEFIPPEYSFEKQADYWWYIYMKDHESKRFMARKEFIDTVEALNSLQHSIVPSDEPKSLPDFEESCSAVLPQEKLNITHLADVEEKLQSIYFPHSKWIKLCLNLGLYKHTLDTISDNFSKDASRCLTECLAKWLKEQDGVRSKGGGAYWSSLKKAVEKIGERWN